MKGSKKLWLIGDNFLATTYRKYFNKNQEFDFLLKKQFEIYTFCNSKYSCKNTNLLSHLQNTLVAALNEQFLLPEYIVVVLDDDIIEYLDYKKYGVSRLYGNWLEWILAEFNAAVTNQFQHLKAKAKADDEPIIYWIAAANHKNFSDEDFSMHDKFNACLDAVVKLYDNIRVVKFREYWYFHKEELVVYNSITRQGFAAYWKSIDSAVSFNIAKNCEFNIRKAFLALKNCRELK